MNDIEKKLKGYYTRSLEHKSDFASLAAKANLVKSKPLPWYKKKIVIFPSLGVLCAGAACAIIVGVTNGLNPSETANINNAVLKMEHGPSAYYLSIDNRGKVSSVYAQDDEAKMITANETIVGKNYWEACKTIIDSEVASGYYVMTRDYTRNENKTTFTVYSDNGNYKTALENQAFSYLSSKNVTISKSLVVAEDSSDYTEIAEDNDYVTIEENDSFDQVKEELDEYYKEVENYNTEVVEQFVALCFHYQDKIAYFESAIKVLEDSGKNVTTIKNKVENLKEKTKGYLNVYSNLFIKDDCSYMVQFKSFLDKKIQILTERYESDNSASAAFISGEYDAALQTLISFRKGLFNTLKTTLDEMSEGLEDIIPAAQEEDFRNAVVSSAFYKDYLNRSTGYITSFNNEYKNIFNYWNEIVVTAKLTLQGNISK